MELSGSYPLCFFFQWNIYFFKLVSAVNVTPVTLCQLWRNSRVALRCSAMLLWRYVMFHSRYPIKLQSTHMSVRWKPFVAETTIYTRGGGGGEGHTRSPRGRPVRGAVCCTSCISVCTRFVCMYTCAHGKAFPARLSQSDALSFNVETTLRPRGMTGHRHPRSMLLVSVCTLLSLCSGTSSPGPLINSRPFLVIIISILLNIVRDTCLEKFFLQCKKKYF